MTSVDAGVLPGFVAVILLFLLPPGPDMAYVVAAGLEGGRRAAVRAILGIGTGMAVHATAVVVGLGRAASAYPSLLDAVKVLGAAYLLRLAYVTIRHARRTTTGPDGTTSGRPYVRGLLVSLTNPKLLLFFLAVLPQFLGQARSTASQLAMLGAVNVLTEMILYGALGVLAGGLHARFETSRQASVAMNYVAGAVYVVLGAAVLAETVAS